jgi:hypothetical protein
MLRRSAYQSAISTNCVRCGEYRSRQGLILITGLALHREPYSLIDACAAQGGTAVPGKAVQAIMHGSYELLEPPNLAVLHPGEPRCEPSSRLEVRPLPRHGRASRQQCRHRVRRAFVQKSRGPEPVASSQGAQLLGLLVAFRGDKEGPEQDKACEMSCSQRYQARHPPLNNEGGEEPPRTVFLAGPPAPRPL